nr:DUF1016 domain-containing protein [Xaviernesmea oryzae]
MKDPYSFDFLALGPAMSERELEQGLLEHLRSLILELGKGFAFVGSQHPLEIGGQDYYLDLLFYHLRLRCFVVVELKIEDFKPEFAGKMNFYLSAVDDLLRHESDAPSIGIILCKGKNEVIVEYALRDSTKPMGVAEYRLSAALPEPLQTELPTEAEFAREFPLMTLVKLRMEVEREIRLLVADQADAERPLALGPMLAELHRLGMLSPTADRFRSALQIMNRAAHGLDVAPTDASEATEIATAFLAELRAIRDRQLS